ncbi:MAG: hypothetical protein ACK5PO_07380, partial [Bacteroidota bacterium]
RSEVVATGKLPLSWPVYRISVAETSCRRRDLAFSGGPTYSLNGIAAKSESCVSIILAHYNSDSKGITCVVADGGMNRHE